MSEQMCNCSWDLYSERPCSYCPDGLHGLCNYCDAETTCKWKDKLEEMKKSILHELYLLTVRLDIVKGRSFEKDTGNRIDRERQRIQKLREWVNDVQ